MPTLNISGINRIQPGRVYNAYEEVNYLDVTKRLVHIEQILSGKINEYNGPVVPIGGLITFMSGFSGVPIPELNFWKCDGSTVNDKDSLLNGQVLPTVSGTVGGVNYWGYVRTK